MRPLLAQNVSRLEWRDVLTARQQEIVALICRGLSNKEIARELRLSEGKTKVHYPCENWLPEPNGNKLRRHGSHLNRPSWERACVYIVGYMRASQQM